jgi:hypothetical protein
VFDALLRRLGLRRDSQELVHVQLVFEHGAPVLLGPMTRFTAEVFLVNRVSPNPFYGQRRVTRARIIS